jgi:hypothetical protein
MQQNPLENTFSQSISKIHSTMTYEPFEAHEQNTNQTIEIFIAKVNWNNN